MSVSVQPATLVMGDNVLVCRIFETIVSLEDLKIGTLTYIELNSCHGTGHCVCRGRGENKKIKFRSASKFPK